MLEKQPVRETNCDQRENNKKPEKNGQKQIQPPISERAAQGQSSIPGQGFFGERLTKRQGQQKSNRSATAEEPTVFFHKYPNRSEGSVPQKTPTLDSESLPMELIL